MCSVTDGHGFDLSDAGCTRALSFVAVSICAALTSRPCLALLSPPFYCREPRCLLRESYSQIIASSEYKFINIIS